MAPRDNLPESNCSGWLIKRILSHKINKGKHRAEDRGRRSEVRGQGKFIRKLENWRIRKLVKQINCLPLTAYRLLFNESTIANYSELRGLSSS